MACVTACGCAGTAAGGAAATEPGAPKLIAAPGWVPAFTTGMRGVLVGRDLIAGLAAAGSSNGWAVVAAGIEPAEFPGVTAGAGPERTSFPKLTLVTVPKSFSVTRPALSSTASSSILPSRSPSAKSSGSSFAGPPVLGAGARVLSTASFLPKMVVMPVRIILGGGAPGAACGGKGEGVSRRPKTLRSTMLASTGLLKNQTQSSCRLKPMNSLMRPQRCRLKKRRPNCRLRT